MKTIYTKYFTEKSVKDSLKRGVCAAESIAISLSGAQGQNLLVQSFILDGLDTNGSAQGGLDLTTGGCFVVTDEDDFGFPETADIEITKAVDNAAPNVGDVGGGVNNHGGQSGHIGQLPQKRFPESEKLYRNIALVHLFTSGDRTTMRLARYPEELSSFNLIKTHENENSASLY